MDKYLRGAESTSTLDRLRNLRLIENLTIGAGTGAYRTKSMHGAGTPETREVIIRRLWDLEGKKALARRLAGVEDRPGCNEMRTLGIMGL